MQKTEYRTDQMIPEWETLTLANDFMFFVVMQDEELLKELVCRILPNLHISHLKIQGQKQIEIGHDIRGVRFDIFATDKAGRAITVEMQVMNRGSLPKRLRFYSSMADTQLLEKGALYSDLPDSYVIMICMYDHYEKGLHRYTFSCRCEESPELDMGNGTQYIVLFAGGAADDIDEKLRNVLDYIVDEKPRDDYTRKLDAAVAHGRLNKEWRRVFMTLQQRDLENKAIGYAERDRVKIREMLERGKTPQEISDFCNYSLDLVKEIHESMMAVAK